MALKRIAIGVPAQPGWYLDPLNATGFASDNNPGTLARPLLTQFGLNVRTRSQWTNLSTRTDVYLLSPFPNDAPMWPIFFSTIGTGFIFIHGGQTKLVSGLRVNAKQDLVRSLNQPMTITATGFDFTPYIGTSFVRLTSGPNTGAMAEIREQLSMGRIRLGEMFIPDPFSVSPNVVFALAGGESFDVVQPWHVPALLTQVDGPRHQHIADPPDLVIQDCAIKGNGSEVTTIRGTVVNFTSCTIDNASYQATVTQQQGTILNAGSFHLIENGSQMSVYGGAPWGAFVAVNDGILGISRDWGPDAGGEVVIAATGYCFGTEVSAFNSDIPFAVEPGGKMQMIQGSTSHTLWGTGNTTTPVQVGADASLIISPVVTLAITGGASDFMLDDLTSLNGNALTWANLRNPAKFNGNAVAPNMARVVNSNSY